MIETGLKALFITTLTLGVFVPLVAWVGRKHGALMQDRIGANRADLAGVRFLGLLHPLADAIKLLTKEVVAPRGASRALHALAPLVAFVPAIAVLCVIPFGGRYAFGTHELSLAVSDPDWGVLFVLAAGSLAVGAASVAGWAGGSDASRFAGIRASVQAFSYQITLGLSLAGLSMVAGSLSLVDLAGFQDGTFRVLGFVERLGVAALPDWTDRLRLPLWGVFYQPLGFVLFGVGVLGARLRPPFDGPAAWSEVPAGYRMETSGAGFGLLLAAGLLDVTLIAMLLATFYFGGWAIPYVSTDAFVGAVSAVFGRGFATGLCLLVQVAVFVAKTALLIWLQLQVRQALPPLRLEQAMKLCRRTILPLSIANVFVTGLVLLGIGAGG